MQKSFICPHCQQEVTVAESSATEVVPQVTVPEKVPFFKSGKRKILKGKLRELNADGNLSETDERVLEETAIVLGLKNYPKIEPTQAQSRGVGDFRQLALIQFAAT